MNKTIISCGGTGGHFYPGLSLAREFKKENSSVQLYLTGLHTEKQSQIAKDFSIHFHCASSPRLPQSKSQIFSFAFKFLKAFCQAWSFLAREKPSKILLMGSFAGVPLGLAARLRSIPIYLHEGNSVVGKSNRLMSRFAKKIFLSFDIVNASAIHCPSEMTGMPLRPEICRAFDSVDKTACYKSFGLDPEKKTIFVFGGSLGARIITETFQELLPGLAKDKVQVIHLTGTEPSHELVFAYQNASLTHLLKAQHQNMVELYAMADLVICRAGASSLAEISLFPVKAIYIPLKIAADNHQYFNAEQELKNSVSLIEEKNLSSDRLLQEINEKLNTPERGEELKTSQNKHYHASSQVVHQLLQ